MEDSDGGYDFSYENTEFSGSEASDGDFALQAEVDTPQRRAKYAVFSEGQLQERQAETVSQVTTVLGISDVAAARVLRHYKWDANRVNEEWWADTEGVRGRLGLQEEQPRASTSGKKVRCNICFEEFRPSSMCAAVCRHHFCKDCWRGYVSNAVDSGPSVALGLRCPLPDCSVACLLFRKYFALIFVSKDCQNLLFEQVPLSVIREVAAEATLQKYERFELRSFVEDNRRMEWCPAPDCEHAVECLTDAAGEPLDVTCSCGCSFCFTCKEEAHRPVTCETVKKWVFKNSAESENLNWILANTKPCPKCKRPIEKNQGCMHMTCSQCSYQFCWLCLAPWTEHGERTGGFYACNRYEAAKKKGEYDEEAQKREHAKHALERYMHYYQRWAENDKARLAAAANMRRTQDKTLELLSNLYATPTSQLKFVTDAWAQVVECRRILKWTYAFGYYNFDESIKSKHSTTVLKQQQGFFEFNQGQAEFYLERLHGVTEKQLETLALKETKVSMEEWGKFREKLIGLTDVTKSHFEKLVQWVACTSEIAVQELEKGMEKMLDDYNEQITPEPATDSGPSAPETAKAKDKKKDGRTAKPLRSTKRTRAAQKSAGAPGAGPSDAVELLDMDSEAEESLGFWQCRSCTFANQDLAADHCEICRAARARR